MHLDGFVIEREIPAPASEILAAIARGGEWRESAIPNELKKGAVIGIDTWVKGSKFRWYYARTRYRAQENYLELWGRVETSPNGGSRVIARCGYNRGLTGFMVGAGVIALLIALSGGGFGALVLPLIAVVVALVTFAWNSRAASGTDSEANYLVERFEQLLHPFITKASVRAPAI